MHAKRSKPVTHEERIEIAKSEAKKKWKDAQEVHIVRADRADRNGISTVFGKATFSDGTTREFYVRMDIHTRHVLYCGEVQGDIFTVHTFKRKV